MNQQEEASTGAMGCMLGLVSIVFLVLLRAWAVELMWGWFVVPLGVAPIGIWHALGFALLVSLFMKHQNDTDHKFDSNKERLWFIVTYLIGRTASLLILVAMGWAVHGSMG